MRPRSKRLSVKVLVVCAGNTCRSPMAGGLLRRLASERGVKIDVRTAGLAAHPGRPVEQKAVEVMAELGIDISHECSKRVTRRDVAWADAIVGTEPEHEMYLREDHPEAASKIMSFPERVPDPFGEPVKVYRACRDQLARLVRELPLWAHAAARGSTE